MGMNRDITAADGHRLGAYESRRDGNQRWLVVVQEAFGVNPHIRNVCDRFAEAGFNVIAPQLFDRVDRDLVLPYSPAGVARYQEIRQVLRKGDVVHDIEAAADATGTREVGIVGYCFGGLVSWWGATASRRFAAASCWYGGGIHDERQAQPNCPVQMHFGERDAHIPMEQVEAIRSAQPNVEQWVYPGADHGFGCDERPSFHAPSRDLAQQRTLDFFRRHLKVAD